ncbi:MAG: hypothetical protein JW812_02795 [Alphaproteobacteria bacterium]|nr:hypothetical protein [Alphaproteobacteria bacterium]MBN2779893.1 hypothetical protein [Alphaproteobacteria bacterium]
MRQTGRMLLEVLLVMVIIAGLLPFLHKQNLKKKEALEYATISAEMQKVKSIFESYLNESPLLFENGSYAQVKQVPFALLYDFGVPESIKEKNRYGMVYTLLGRRRVLRSGGIPIIDGLVLLSSEKFTALQIRRLSRVLGPEGGYTEDGFIYSSNQSWMETTKDWDLNLTQDQVALKIAAIESSQGYIHRKYTGDPNTQIMRTHLKMGYHDIIDVGHLDVGAAEVFDSLYYKNMMTESEGPAIHTFELLNQSKQIDLEYDYDNYSCESCPRIRTLTLAGVTSKANIIGSSKILGTLTIDDELRVLNDLFLSGELKVKEATTYTLDVDELNVETAEGSKLVYDIKTKDLKVSKLTIDSLSVPIGMFGSISFSESARIKNTNTFFEGSDLRLKDMILKKLNQWIYDKRNDCYNHIYASPSDCTSLLSTRPLFECLTVGINTEKFTMLGKGYSIDQGDFERTVLFSDILDCLEALKAVVCGPTENPTGYCS